MSDVNGMLLSQLRALITWFDKHDGKAEDFGDLFVVADAKAIVRIVECDGDLIAGFTMERDSPCKITMSMPGHSGSRIIFQVRKRRWREWFWERGPKLHGIEIIALGLADIEDGKEIV